MYVFVRLHTHCFFGMCIIIQIYYEYDLIMMPRNNQSIRIFSIAPLYADKPQQRFVYNCLLVQIVQFLDAFENEHIEYLLRLKQEQHS